MTRFPASPRVLRGALVAVDPVTMVSSVLPFQFNPTSLSRSFQIGGATAGAEAGQRGGPPVETIQVEIELDATDDLEAEKGSGAVRARLSAILGLVSPPTTDVQANLERMAQGLLEILPPDAPLVLFVYGPNRVVPVQLTEISIAEEAFDANLDPIRARVSLGMQVLSYADLQRDHAAHAITMANAVAREARSRTLVSSGLDATLGLRDPLV